MYIAPKALPATKIIGDCIAVWENAWLNPDKTIEQLEKEINSMPNLNWVPAGVSNNDGSRTNSNLGLKMTAKESEIVRNISNQYLDLVASALEWYIEKFGIRESIYMYEEFNALKYQTGEEYQAHYDGGTETKRVISPILYLNDNYEGGEIEFVNQKIKIKPKSGMFLIFPANFAYRHIAHPVISGTKYGIVTWLHDAP